MKNTLDAIKYGLENLDVSPKELFKLIESSKGYDGADYKRWLANEIIKLAEKDGIGYSQLLAKWFNLIQNIIEEYADDSLKEYFERYIKELADNNKIFTVGINNERSTFGIGAEVDDIDWYDRVDLPYNYDFLDTVEKFGSDIIDNSGVTIIYKSNPKAVFKKNSALAVDAKLNGVPVRNGDSLFLYKMCTIVRALESEVHGCDKFKFVFITDTKFLYSAENKEIIKYLLGYFKYNEKSCVVNTKDLYEGSFTSEDYAICLFQARGEDDESQDGILLRSMVSANDKVEGEYQDGTSWKPMVPTDEEYVLSDKAKRYSEGGDMLEKLYSVYGSEERYNAKVPTLDRGMTKIVGASKGIKGAYGYLCKGRVDRNAFLSCYPVENTKYIAITEENLHKVIAYYGVSQSMDGSGLFSGISDILDGHPDYHSLVGNCIPVFLFDIDSRFKDIGTVKYNGVSYKLNNCFDIASSALVERLLDEGSVYFSYEAKELLQICKGFIDYFKENCGEDMTGKTFEEIRREANNEDLNRAYLNALKNCKEYISSEYRAMS